MPNLRRRQAACACILTLACGSTIGSASYPGHLPSIRLEQTSSQDSARLYRHLQECPVRQLQSLYDSKLSKPLIVHASDTIQVIFGAAYGQENLVPRLSIRLRDIELLPSASETATWGTDSAWGFTRCEALMHELSEAIEYSRLWDTGADSLDRRARFPDWLRRAHQFALQTEEIVATSQRSRLRPDGSAYARSHECIRGGAMHIGFGRHTQTFVFKFGTLHRILYTRDVDLCAVL